MEKLRSIVRRLITVLVLFVVGSCATVSETEPQTSAFSIRFLDVGQADAALVACDGHYMLIDGGHKRDSDKMYAVLKEADIRHLDIVVGTHPDIDHIGGLAGALNYASADLVLSPVLEYASEEFKAFSTYAELNGSGISVPEAGETYPLGSAVVTILGLNSGETSNDSSIVLKISYGETSFLFTGDGEAQTEQVLLETGADLSATVLKVAHHGSADSSTEAFLDAVAPEYAIISVGENTYYHPTKAALERLDASGAKIYRTDLQGEVQVTSDRKTIEISCEREATREEIMISAAERTRLQEETEAKENHAIRDQGVQNSGSDGENYAVNMKTGKIHIVGKCPATGNGEHAMKSPKYFSSYEDAYHYAVTRAKDAAKVNCGNCW